MIIRRRNILYVFTALCLSIAVIFLYRHHDPHEGKVFLHAVPVHTAIGWGYHILAGERIYIKQETIPGLPGHKGFRSSEEAMRTAALVVRRISAGQQPTITLQDLHDLGIETDTAKLHSF